MTLLEADLQPLENSVISSGRKTRQIQLVVKKLDIAHPSFFSSPSKTLLWFELSHGALQTPNTSLITSCVCREERLWIDLLFHLGTRLLHYYYHFSLQKNEII